MTYPIDRVRDRYMNDATFHAYVDMMRKAIVELHLTPGEVREAAMLAAIIEEERRPAAYVIPLDQDLLKRGPYR